MTTLRKRMLGALGDIETAAKFIEADWQRHRHVGIHPDAQAAHDLHMAGLRDAWRIIADFGDAPEDFELLMKLRAEKRSDFDAIMVLVKIELERKPVEPVSEAA